jgi:hypothetical protein
LLEIVILGLQSMSLSSWLLANAGIARNQKHLTQSHEDHKEEVPIFFERVLTDKGLMGLPQKMILSANPYWRAGKKRGD